MLSSTAKTELGNKTPIENLAKELHKTKNVLKAVYDFSVSGGAVGDIGLLDDDGNPAKIPANAIVTRVLIDVLTAPTSGGSATVAGKLVNAADLLAATAIASITGFVAGKPDEAVANLVKPTSETQVKITVAVAALTAGKFNMFLEYNLST